MHKSRSGVDTYGSTGLDIFSPGYACRLRFSPDDYVRSDRHPFATVPHDILWRWIPVLLQGNQGIEK